MDNGATHPARLAGGTKDVAITERRLQSAFITTCWKRNLPWVSQTDVGLGIPAEANLAQEAGLVQHEGVLTLVEELVGAMESLIGFVSIWDTQGPTDVSHSRCSRRRKGHDAQHVEHERP